MKETDDIVRELRSSISQVREAVEINIKQIIKLNEIVEGLVLRNEGKDSDSKNKKENNTCFKGPCVICGFCKSGKVSFQHVFFCNNKKSPRYLLVSNMIKDGCNEFKVEMEEKQDG